MRLLQNQIILLKYEICLFAALAFSFGENGGAFATALECGLGDIPMEKALRVADFNGDGLDDVICHRRNGTITIAFNTFSMLDFFTASKRSLRRLCFYRCESVHRKGACVVAGGRAWLPGGWRVWLQGGCVAAGGVCVVVGGGIRGCGGACMVAGGHAWLQGVIRGCGGHA